jgi:threonine dehydrogenase-like Zn-dependent dehydrogenase
MRALVLGPSGKLTLENRPKPPAGAECVIRVDAAGICGTDLELLRGYAGFSGVPGHEFVGTVEDAPSADRHWIGRRVAGEITVGCGRCAGCLRAGRGHCDARTVVGIRERDGAFADYLSLPSENLHEIPATLDDAAAVFVEPTAAACRVTDQVQVGLGTRAAVVGAGRLGLLVALVLRHHGAAVTIVRRGNASGSRATTLGFETRAIDDASLLARGFDLVVDATGEPEGFSLAASLVRPRGTLVLKSTFHGDTSVNLSPFVVDEVTIVGSRCGPFDRAIDLLASKAFDVQPLVSGVYRLEQFVDAFDRARSGGKVLFAFR